MKKIFLLLFIFQLSSTAWSEVIVKLANGEWPPYHSINLKHHGVASHIIEEAFALEGIKVHYHFAPWKRGMKMAEYGELNGTAVWRYQSDIQEKFYYSDPVFTSETVFFHLKSFPFAWNEFTDLKGLRIGGTIGYTYNEDYRKAEASKEYNIQRISNDELNFSMLLRNRIDIFPITKEVGYFLLQTQYTQNQASLFTYHAKSMTPEHERTLHLLLSKHDEKNQQLMASFNKGLKKLKESGLYHQYLKDLKEGKYLHNADVE